MKKYKNIVFDLGNVLIDYSPHIIVSNFTDDTDTIQTLVYEIFYQQEWLDLDQGITSYDEAYISITKRIQQDKHDLVRDILDKWHEYMYEREEMIELLERLKQKGYKLYLFSNTPKRFYDYCKKFKCLTYFDEMIISADIKHSKPSEAFYTKACQLCQIELTDSFFIDDSVQNVIQASLIGMDGYIYNGSIERLYQYLKHLNIID